MTFFGLNLYHAKSGIISFWGGSPKIFKACLHVPTPFPSKFIIMPMVTGSPTGRMGSIPILPVRLPVTIITMLNFDRHCDGDGNGLGTCKQAFMGYCSFNFVQSFETAKCNCDLAKSRLTGIIIIMAEMVQNSFCIPHLLPRSFSQTHLYWSNFLSKVPYPVLDRKGGGVLHTGDGVPAPVSTGMGYPPSRSLPSKLA